MKSELIVDVQSDEITMALTEDDRLMEWGVESRESATFAVGNIYYGRVKKVMPALNACFVDVGHEKEAFLHYLDLGSQFLTLEKFTQFAVQEKQKKPLMHKTPNQKEVGKQGSIQDVCRVGQEILVQVAKEPINTKGPRLTAEISLAGRNIVLIPFGEKVMVSSKIKSEAERSRLKQLVQAIKPERFGVIVRTVAEGKRAAELDSELRLLLKRWEDTVSRLQKAKPVSLVTEEIGRTIGEIRDVFTPDFTSIYVNDEAMYEEVRSYVGLIAPECEKIVKLYKEDQPIFDHFGITRQMKTGLGRTVGFKNGGYLIMERTEALFSIDVNSGSKKLGTDQEDNAFQCNMLAADEIYHQLRLRDIGGIIIVDFIDMDSAEHRQLLFEHMRRLMKRDRARHNVLQLSKFGLMQITRQRVRPVVEVDVQEVCPTCGGKGKVQPSILFTDTLDEQIELYQMHFGRGMKLYVHPFVYAYASKGLIFTNLKFKWYRKYGVRLIADESLPLLEYRFVDKNGKKLELPKMVADSADKKADKKAKLYTAKPIEEKPEVVLPKPDEKASESVADERVSAEAIAADLAAAASSGMSKSAKKRARKKKAKAEAIAQEAAATQDAAQVSAREEAATEEEKVHESAPAAAAGDANAEKKPAKAPKAKRPSRSKKVREAEEARAAAAANAAGAAVAAEAEVREQAPQAAPAAEVPAAEPAAEAPKKAPKSKRRTAPKEAAPAKEAAAEASEKAAEAAPEASEAKPAKPTKKRQPKKAKAAEQTEAPAAEVTAAETPAAEAPAAAAEAKPKPVRKRAPRKSGKKAQEAKTDENPDKQEA